MILLKHTKTCCLINTWLLTTSLLCRLNMSSAQSVYITRAPTVIINEVMTTNLNSDKDETSSYEDWVELYNVASTSMDLTGWGLSNSDKSPFRWTFPPGTTIASNAYLRVWASKKSLNYIPVEPTHKLQYRQWC